MKTFKTLQPISMFQGIIRLGQQQADVRRGCLKHIADDMYEIIKPVQFKVGEVIGLEKVEKAHQPSLAPLKKADK